MIKKPLFFMFFLAPALLCAEALYAQTQPDTSYKVGVGDVIQVSVIQPDQMETTLTVSPDGTVVFPQIGQISVMGLTPFEVQEKIQSALREYYNYPLVSVSLKESHSQNFYIHGEVLKPGTYPMKENSTVLQAAAMAGGFTRSALLSGITVVRQNPETDENQTTKINLSGAQPDKKADNFKLKAGDVITVPRGGDVYVYGEVNNPGPYPLEENTTLLQAIVMAGGFTPVAAMDNVKVMRQKNSGQDNETFTVDLNAPRSGESMDKSMAEPGDVITVPKRFF